RSRSCWRPSPWRVAVDVVAKFTTEDLTEEDRALLMRNTIDMAAERLSDLVGDLAEDLADNYLYTLRTRRAYRTKARSAAAGIGSAPSAAFASSGARRNASSLACVSSLRMNNKSH